MSTGVFFIILLGLHPDLRVLLEIQLCKLRVVIQALPAMLKIVVSEEACIDMLREKFSKLKNHLVLDHLIFKLIIDINKLIP